VSIGEDNETSVYEESLTSSTPNEKPVRKTPANKGDNTPDTITIEADNTGIDSPAEEARVSSISTAPSAEYEVTSVEIQDSEEESISSKAREAGRSLKDLAYSLGKKTKETAEQKTAELKAKSVDIGATTDAREIQNLGTHVDDLVQVFEDTMAEIRKEPYAEQEKILVGYRKLLEEQINVVNARLNLAKRLKPGA
jgi:hypothetical protein